MYVQLVLLSCELGSVSSGNLLGLDIMGSKVQEIVGDDIVTFGYKESCLLQNRNFEIQNIITKALLCFN